MLTTVTPGKVYVASKKFRGPHATPLDPRAVKVDVTSAQATASANRRDFSPMTPNQDGYRGFWNFESFWQSGKVFEGLDHRTSKLWWIQQKAPKRRYPNSKGKKVLYAKWDHTRPLGYVESRKQVYVPEYSAMIADREMLKYWKDQVARGVNVTIYDFDGPKLPDGSITCCELTKELLQEKINDETHPFGHGYIVAAMIAGINVDEYIM